jgi:hypothetical protein
MWLLAARAVPGYFWHWSERTIVGHEMLCENFVTVHEFTNIYLFSL